MAQYNNVTSQADQVASTPYQSYSGQLVAPVNSQQTAGINAVNSASGIQNPYNAGATGLAAASASGINPDTVNSAAIQQYESPYQSDVVNSTLAEINNQNQQQASSLTGNAISSGAFGGDRAGVAQAALAGQQDLASNQTIAGLNNQNYQQALSEANTQQTAGMTAQQETAANALAASQQLGNIGSTAQTEALNEANAQTAAGTLQQTTQQAQDTANYNQYLQQLAYPFQTTGWLANIVEGIGSQSGGTSTGTTQTDTNSANSILGGLVGLGSFLARGGRVPHFARGGLVPPHMAGGGGLGGGVYPGVYDPTAAGGMQGLGGGSVVPTPSLQIGHTMPQGNMGLAGNQQAPSAMQTANSIAQTAKGVNGLANGVGGLFGANASGDYSQAGAGAYGLANGLDMSDIGLARGGRTGLAGAYFAGGGTVLGDSSLMRRPHYDDGGSISADSLAFDPNALNADSTGLLPAGAMVAPPAGLVPAIPTTPAADPSPPQSDSATKQQQVDLMLKTLNDNAGTASDSATPTFASGNVPPISADATAQPSPGLAPASSGATGLAASLTVPVGLAPPLPASSATGLAPAPATGLAPPTTAASTGTLTSATGLVPPSSAAPTDPASLPRGLRNNNPGNLVDNSWTQSLPGYAGSDGHFAIFNSPEAGSAALDRNLQSYGAQGLNTPIQISSKWAPAGDGGNDPVAYAGVIAKTLGVGINDPIDMTDPAVRAKVGSAISKVENGTGLAGGTGAGSALGYVGGDQDGSASSNSVTGGIGAIAHAIGLGGLAGNGTDTGASTSGSIIPGAPSTGHSGLLGLNLSDNTRLGMLAAGLGIMGSPSMSVGQAIGQGGLQGLQVAMQGAKQNAEISNYGSEIRNRNAQTQNINSETQYRPAEVGIRQQNANTEYMKAQGQRYTMLPGPNGDFRYIDNFNPGRGILSAAQIAGGGQIAPTAIVPPPMGAPPTAGMSGSAGAPIGSISAGVNPPGENTQGASQPNAQLDSSRFMSTGNPTLAAPSNYLPTNYYANQLRLQRDPAFKATMEKQTVDDVTGANMRAQKAYGGLYYSDEMDRNADALPNSGFLAPGANFPERLSLAKNWNAAVTGLGMDGLSVNADAVKAGESLIKDKTRLGAQLTQALGSREAATVFSSMMSAVPGGDNTRAGYKAISSSLRSLGQREIDHSAFMQDYASRYGNTSGAEAAFNQLNPPMQYARQAQAMAHVPQASIDLLRANSNNPRAITAFEQKYGPGLSRYYTGQFA